MAWKHQGASTAKHQWKYPHRARCIYSGNTGTVYSKFEEVTEQWQQDKLDNEFMIKHCDCSRCVSERERKARLKAALEESGATESLKAMGW